MATLKHLSSKNADYGVAEQYLTFEHDEFTGKPILDENGRLVPRQDYRISSLNCGEEDFAVACMRANLRYGKNQQREDVKSHHYILSFDPRDGPDHGLTMDKAQALGERFCAEQFPGHQALVCTHPDGHNHSGNIHVHIVINSLRVAEVERKPYMDRASDTQAGAKHRCTAAAMRHFRAEVMELCQGAGLYQIDLLGGSKNRVTEREYWAQKKGQLALDTEAAAQGKPPTKFETDKEKLRREIRAVLNLAVSFEDFAQRLLQRGITVKESRGRLSYLTPDRAKPITARKLGDDFDRAAVGAALERNAARPSLGAKPSIREQLRQPQGVQRMVDIEAKKAEGKGIGYQQWASVFNLKQIANSVNVYTEYGFSSPEELDAAVSAAFAAVRDSAASLKPKELALKEKKELRRQIIIYRNTKAVRDGLAAQKTPKARAAYRQEHEGDLLLSEATIRFFKANGITKLPTVKELTAEKRIGELNGIFKRLYEDSVSGRITDERFMELSTDYEQEQATLKARAAELQAELGQAQEAAVNVEKFMAVVRKYTSFEELTPTLLREFVEKIVVHECWKDEQGTRHQDIEIYYSFVGKVDLPDD